MDNLIKSCLAIKKTINTKTSLPEAREKIEAFLLDILNLYADPGLLAIWIAEAETEKFMRENIGKPVSLIGHVNENSHQIARAEFMIWQVILEKKYQYAMDAKIKYGIPYCLWDKWYPGIKIILKKSVCLRGGDIVTISGVLGVNTDPKCPYVVHSADLLKYEKEPGSYDNRLENRLGEYKSWLGEHKKKFIEIKEIIRIEKTKQGRPFSMRYLDILKRSLNSEKDSITYYTQKVKEWQGKVAIAQKYGMDTVGRIDRIEFLKDEISSRKQEVEKLDEQLRNGISTRGKTKGQTYSKQTIMQIKRDIKFLGECIKKREEEIRQLSDTETLKAYTALHSDRKENNHLRLVKA